MVYGMRRKTDQAVYDMYLELCSLPTSYGKYVSMQCLNRNWLVSFVTGFEGKQGKYVFKRSVNTVLINLCLLVNFGCCVKSSHSKMFRNAIKHAIFEYVLSFHNIRAKIPLRVVTSGSPVTTAARAHNQKWLNKTKISARQLIAAKRLDIWY